MALIHINFHSNALKMTASCDVIMPHKTFGQIGVNSAGRSKKHPVLWLLHGMSEDQTVWQRRTSIERYAGPLGLAVVMPAAHLSAYANMAHGLRFYDYIAKELPEKMRGFFPFSEKREDNFIAGLSMGGMGCLKIGLANPEQYAAIGCLSSPAQTFRGKVSFLAPGEYERRQELIFGGRDITGTEEDIHAGVKRILEEKLPAPRIYHTCGTEDFLLYSARQTRDYFYSFEGNPFNYFYEEHPGAHTWEYWDGHIQRFLEWLEL